MYQLIPLHSCDYLWKSSIKINMGTEEGKQPKWNVTLNKDEVGVAVESSLSVRVEHMAW